MSTIRGELGKFIEALVAAEVDFVICGGVACILHGLSRTTADLDIALRMEQRNLAGLLGVAARFKLEPRIPEPASALLDERRRHAWLEGKGAKVFTLVSTHSPLQVAIILDYPIEYEELAGAADEFQSGSLKFKVSSKEDLIKAKRAVKPARKTDLRDIEDLQELMERERE